ncbi:hypothetical protein VN12_26520 [Pirellula sp. SH-Sr6A]|uniref:hypothetical protein n=1 Tax=Pirellula sp. SH-Sr6A TaxID=1632865 RepID=UPI00078E4AF7|nr:hypothetical protein [Pirellula sp. SH-Sr6A]AMV35675.1 hypothetical protein VN12_26520 [Pirellula sp. SH-Sr6A]
MYDQNWLSGLTEDELSGIPNVALAFVVRLLRGACLESLAHRLVREYGQSHWVCDLGYWADLARDDEIQEGLLNGVDGEWRKELQRQARLFEEQQKDFWHEERSENERYYQSIR